MDYLLEVEKQFRDSNIYGVDFNQSINFKIKLLTDLAESSNNMYLNLKWKGLISKKELKYFT